MIKKECAYAYTKGRHEYEKSCNSTSREQETVTDFSTVTYNYHKRRANTSTCSFCFIQRTPESLEFLFHFPFGSGAEPLKKCFAVRGGAKADFRRPFVSAFLIDRAFSPVLLHPHCSNMLLPNGLKTGFFSDHLATKLATKFGVFEPFLGCLEKEEKQNKKTRKPL